MQYEQDIFCNCTRIVLQCKQGSFAVSIELFLQCHRALSTPKKTIATQPYFHYFPYCIRALSNRVLFPTISIDHCAQRFQQSPISHFNRAFFPYSTEPYSQESNYLKLQQLFKIIGLFCKRAL